MYVGKNSCYRLFGYFGSIGRVKIKALEAFIFVLSRQSRVTMAQLKH